MTIKQMLTEEALRAGISERGIEEAHLHASIIAAASKPEEMVGDPLEEELPEELIEPYRKFVRAVLSRMDDPETGKFLDDIEKQMGL